MLNHATSVGTMTRIPPVLERPGAWTPHTGMPRVTGAGPPRRDGQWKCGWWGRPGPMSPRVEGIVGRGTAVVVAASSGPDGHGEIAGRPRDRRRTEANRPVGR